MARNDTLAVDSCGEFTQPEAALGPGADRVDPPGGRIDDHDRDVRCLPEPILDPERNRPVRVRWYAHAHEADVVALGRELDLRARDLDRALLAHVLPAAAGKAGQEEPDRDQGDHERDPRPGDLAEPLAEATRLRAGVDRRPRNGGQGTPGSGRGR